MKARSPKSAIEAQKKMREIRMRSANGFDPGEAVAQSDRIHKEVMAEELSGRHGIQTEEQARRVFLQHAISEAQENFHYLSGEELDEAVRKEMAIEELAELLELPEAIVAEYERDFDATKWWK